jgi:hypothetical protein
MTEGFAEPFIRAQAEAARRLTELWGNLAQANPLLSATQPTDVQDRIRAMLDGVRDYAGLALGPMQEFMQPQGELADRMSDWAGLQREFAGQMEAWAAQQRQFAEAMRSWLKPLLPPRSDPDTTPGSTG